VTKLPLRLIGLFLLLAAVTFVASADSGTLTLVNGGSNAMGGVYVGPYNFTWTSNGQDPSIQLVCDDYSHEVYQGESWTATTYLLSAMNGPTGQFPGSSLNQYEAAALLAQQIFASSNSTQIGLMQYALWDIFTPGASNSVYSTWTTQEQTDFGGYLTEAQNVIANGCSNCNFSDIVIYTPQPNTEHPTYGLPQEYIGLINVPEPGSLMLLVTGLFAFLAFRFISKH